MKIVKKKIVKIATGEELDGDSLINRAFKESDPIIKLNDLNTQSEKDFQKGYFFLFKGAVFAIRNPLSHDSSKISNLEGFHKLIMINDLMTVLEGRIV